MLPTSQQTIGPFFPRGFIGPADNDLTRISADATPTTQGEAIILRGTVTRVGGVPCVNAILEMWQADAAGRFNADPSFLGWGRTFTDAEGHYAFRTIIPGGFTDATGARAPHANITVMGAGLMRRVLTTVFFPGSDTAQDPVMAAVPTALRPLLVAEPARREKGVRCFRFDIRLRGENETPFFDL
ncbi:protocatechuate 3,4-dioxygenase subunit alpha [Roseomonas fluvialis]|uniref:Protocatechuate 3,4-dioxygenase subunit alpha n=1 Tax=Roseomonas fluvialis TaxID=1750527 RepID=A0ABM7XZ02_9PROT|nr:protocatechuate 3,4-dioxygenase subunit alpha [Roseomonas fluvialis]BDG70698.1 protocatechuate 3,4-dioxygenase subunit alpha [Roseomonas fluvialis]